MKGETLIPSSFSPRSSTMFVFTRRVSHGDERHNGIEKAGAVLWLSVWQAERLESFVDHSCQQLWTPQSALSCVCRVMATESNLNEQIGLARTVPALDDHPTNHSFTQPVIISIHNLVACTRISLYLHHYTTNSKDRRRGLECCKDHAHHYTTKTKWWNNTQRTHVLVFSFCTHLGTMTLVYYDITKG